MGPSQGARVAVCLGMLVCTWTSWWRGVDQGSPCTMRPTELASCTPASWDGSRQNPWFPRPLGDSWVHCCFCIY